MRVAIVHDWLLGMRGGERVLEVFCQMFPGADLFTTFYDEEGISEIINRQQLHVSALNQLPFVKQYYRYLLPCYPLAAKLLSRELSRKAATQRYDLVISISHCLAKNITPPASSYHLCYCLTPVRYLWDQYDSYFNDRRLEPLIRLLARPLRNWDEQESRNVDSFVAISDFVRQRIEKFYQRSASVIYPPVRTDWIRPRKPENKGEGFLCVSALVPYKNVEVIVRAFNQLPYRLTVVGTGPEAHKLQRIASPNISFLGNISDSELANLYQRSKALVFAAEEDFGMTPVEAQAAGRPVICYPRGGVLETVCVDAEKPTGIYFPELTPQSLSAAVEDFILRQQEFTIDACLEATERFSLVRFSAALREKLASVGFMLASDARLAKVVGI